MSEDSKIKDETEIDIKSLEDNDSSSDFLNSDPSENANDNIITKDGVEIDEIPKVISDAEFLDAKAAGKEKYTPKSSEENRQYVEKFIEYNPKSNSFFPFILSVLVLAFVIKLKPFTDVSNMKGSIPNDGIILSLLMSILTHYVSLLRMLYPLWVMIIFKFFPFKVPFPYRFNFNYLIIETIYDMTYKSNLSRVKVSWNSITSIEYKEAKQGSYVRLMNSHGGLIGVLYYDGLLNKEVQQGILEFTSGHHPLRQFILSIQ
jgi:hypothetical protein